MNINLVYDPNIANSFITAWFNCFLVKCVIAVILLDFTFVDISHRLKLAQASLWYFTQNVMSTTFALLLFLVWAGLSINWKKSNTLSLRWVKFWCLHKVDNIWEGFCSFRCWLLNLNQPIPIILMCMTSICSFTVFPVINIVVPSTYMIHYVLFLLKVR